MKHLVWFAAFFLLLLAGDRLWALLLDKVARTSQFRYSRMYHGDAGADILLVGNSRGLTFYEPYIAEKTGRKTFNLSYNGLPMDVAKVLVQDYLDRYPAPKVMLIDITSCDRTNDPLLSGFLTYAGQSYRLDTLIHARQATSWWAGQASGLYRYNNEVFQRALFHRNHSDSDWLLDRVIPVHLADEAARNRYDLEVHPYLIRQLKEMVEAAQLRGVRVELTIGPYLPGFTVQNLNELKSAAEDVTGLTVHDYRSALSDVSLFGDFMHPNKRGAKAYMDVLLRDGVLW